MTEALRDFPADWMETGYESLRSHRLSGALPDAAGGALVERGLVSWMSAARCRGGTSPPPSASIPTDGGGVMTGSPAPDQSVGERPGLMEILTDMITRLCGGGFHAFDSRHSVGAENRKAVRSRSLLDAGGDEDLHTVPPQTATFHFRGVVARSASGRREKAPDGSAETGAAAVAPAENTRAPRGGWR